MRETNRYFVCLQGATPVPWVPGDSDAINKHTAYFGGALRAMERGLECGGLVFYLTWDVNALPSYGDNVVAVVLGDEWARIPAYADRVRAVFKCYGTWPTLGVRRPSYLSALTALHVGQVLAARVPTVLRRALARDGRRPARVFSVPLGFANQVDLPVLPPSRRPYDISFAGSVVHRERPPWSPKRWLKTPKSLSRGAMVGALQRLQQNRPDLRVHLTLTSGYAAIQTSDPLTYSRLLADSKVALVPRGTSFETFRFFEAMRAGCVVVSEALPRRWFYDGAPAIRIQDWSELEEVILPILSDEAEVVRRHRESLAWWREVCSEEAVGAFMRDALNGLAV